MSAHSISMGSAGQQEIICTPAAKVARLSVAPRGTAVNFRHAPRRRPSENFTPYAAPIGRLEHANFERLKAEAVTCTSAARALQQLCCDAALFDESPEFQTAAAFAGLDDASLIPSDCQIAAARDYLLVAANAALAVFDPTGWMLLQRNLTDLFAPLIGDDLVIFNPKVVHDQFNSQPGGAWALAACARDADRRRSWLLVAYSQSGDPQGDWSIWALDAQWDGPHQNGLWAEGLGLSVDRDWLYLTANLFGGQGQFCYAKLRVLGKPELRTGGTPRGWDFWDLRNPDGTPAFAVQPAVNLRAAGTQYLLNAATSDARAGGGNASSAAGLTLWSLSHRDQARGGPPTLARRFLPTGAYGLAPDARQPLTARRIETGDTRLSNVIFRHGLLWAAHTVAANWGDDENRAAIQWFQINPRASCITGQGIYGSPRHDYFCPAATVDGAGNLALVFNRVGMDECVSVRVTGRRALDEPGALQASALLQRGYSPASAIWNTTSAACVAPDDARLWLIGQYAATEHDWATWIGALEFVDEPRAALREDYREARYLRV